MRNLIKNLIDKLRTKWEITLTNTILHWIVGLVFGLSGLIVKFIPEFIVFTPIAFFIGTVSFEIAQKERAFKWNWVDSIVDVLAGNIGFNTTYWIIWYLIY